MFHAEGRPQARRIRIIGLKPRRGRIGDAELIGTYINTGVKVVQDRLGWGFMELAIHSLLAHRTSFLHIPRRKMIFSIFASIFGARSIVRVLA